MFINSNITNKHSNNFINIHTSYNKCSRNLKNMNNIFYYKEKNNDTNKIINKENRSTDKTKIMKTIYQKNFILNNTNKNTESDSKNKLLKIYEFKTFYECPNKPKDKIKERNQKVSNSNKNLKDGIINYTNKNNFE